MAFTLRLSAELETELKAFCDRWGVTAHAVVSMAVGDYLRLRGPRPPRGAHQDASGRSLARPAARGEAVGSANAGKLDRASRRRLAREQRKASKRRKGVS